MKMSIERTKMLDEARKSEGRSIGAEIGYVISVFLFSGMLQSILLSVPTYRYMMQNEEYAAAVSEFRAGNITAMEFMDSAMSLSGNMPDFLMVLTLLATVIATLTCVFYCTKTEKRTLASMGFRKNNAGAEYAVGAGVGTLMFSVAVLLCLITGALRFDGVEQHIRWGYVALFLCGFLIQGMSEEVVCRGYFMISVSRKHSIAVSVLLSSVFFAALHLMNHGISLLPFINLVLFGVFAALYMLKRGNIWGACGVHSLWNFVQGNFYGVSVSGSGKMPTILNMSSVDTKTIINGGEFGLEGGLAVTIVYTIGIIILLCMKTKQSELSNEGDNEVK